MVDPPLSAGASVRRLQVFSLHGHVAGNKNPVYIELFRALAKLKEHKTLAKGDRTATIRSCIERPETSGRFFIRMYEGVAGEAALLYDFETTGERTLEVDENEGVVQVTHVIVDTPTRTVVVEFNKFGAKAGDLGDLVSYSFNESEEFPELNFYLTPRVSQNLVQEIESMEIIREADISVARPNAGWDDMAESLISEMEESNAGSIDVSVKAPPRGSLSPDGGIIDKIKAFAQNPFSGLKNLRVKGRRAQESLDRDVKLKDNIVQEKRKFQRDADGRLPTGEVETALNEVLEQFKN